MFLNFFLAEVTIVYKTNASQAEEKEKEGRAAFQRLKEIEFKKIKGCEDNNKSSKCCSVERKKIVEMLKNMIYYPPSELPKTIRFKRIQDTDVHQVDVYSILKYLFHTNDYDYEQAKKAGFKDSVFISLEEHIISHLRATEPYNEPEKKVSVFAKIGNFLREERAPKPPPIHNTIEELLPAYANHYQKGPLKRQHTQKRVQKPPTPEETTYQSPENTIQQSTMTHMEKESEQSNALRNVGLVLVTSILWSAYYSLPTKRKKRKRRKRNHTRTSPKIKKNNTILHKPPY